MDQLVQEARYPGAVCVEIGFAAQSKLARMQRFTPFVSLRNGLGAGGERTGVEFLVQAWANFGDVFYGYHYV